MNAEQQARMIGESPSCGCGCANCGQNIYTLYRAVLDQAARICELEKILGPFVDVNGRAK